MLKSKIIEIRYSIELTELQMEILEEKCASDFITIMEHQTQAENIVWGYHFGYSIFVTLHFESSLGKVIKFLEDNLSD